MNRLMASLACLAVLLVAPESRGDGMMYQQLGASGAVRATEQRAVMWSRGGTWEIHIQPVFDRQAGAAAWVVPFPVLPDVQEGDADFFDELELFTSPVFIETCWESHDTGCFMEKAGDNALGEASDATARVQVWERGAVGELDYVILSSADGDDLVTWLEGEGFGVPEGTDELITTYGTEGVYFFVARIADGVDPALPLSPVRFVLDGVSSPSYPLRLTGLGMPDGEELELTVWVIFPRLEGDPGWVPMSHTFGELDDWPEDIDEFDEMRDAFHSSGEADLLIRSTLTDDEIDYMMDMESFCAEPWFEATCVPFADLGVDVPETWSEEMNEVRETPGYVFRYEGRLGAAQMNLDLTLRRVDTWALPWATNIYQISRGQCREDPGCAIAGRADTRGAWILVVLVILGLGVRLLRRRRPHRER